MVFRPQKYLLLAMVNNFYLLFGKIVFILLFNFIDIYLLIISNFIFTTDN
jgi:hypothetical protein